MNHVDYDLGCKIINHPVFDEVIDARDVASDILFNERIMQIIIPERLEWSMKPNHCYFNMKWPRVLRDNNLDDDISKACREVLDFGDELNELEYEELFYGDYYPFE